MREKGVQRINIRCYYGTINKIVIPAKINIVTTTCLLQGNIPKHKAAVFTLQAKARDSQRSWQTVQSVGKVRNPNEQVNNRPFSKQKRTQIYLSWEKECVTTGKEKLLSTLNFVGHSYTIHNDLLKWHSFHQRQANEKQMHILEILMRSL